MPDRPSRAVRIRSGKSGFLHYLDGRGLADRLVSLEAIVLLDARPGDAVILGTPVGWAWADRFDSGVDTEAVQEALSESLVVGFERVDAGDPSYGLRKLADIAIRALSPGINDPTTAVHALSHISALLGEAAVHDAWHRSVTDRADCPRVHHRSWDYPALLDLAFTQIVHYGHTDPMVVDRLFGTLIEAGWRVDSSLQRRAVRKQCGLLRKICMRDLPTGWSSDDVTNRACAVQEALTGGNP